MKWTDEDVKMVEKFIEIRNKGFYVDGGQLTQVYNRVLEKHVNPTSCGSCLRQRVNELSDALNRFKALSKAVESVSEVEVEDTKEDENKAVGNASSLHSNTIGMSRNKKKK